MSRVLSRILLLATLLGSLLGACDTLDPAAPEKCQELVDALCLNAAEHCYPPTLEGVCQNQFAREMPCEDAVDISATFEDCLDYLADPEECITDELLFPLACEGVVLFPAEADED